MVEYNIKIYTFHNLAFDDSTNKDKFFIAKYVFLLLPV